MPGSALTVKLVMYHRIHQITDKALPCRWVDGALLQFQSKNPFSQGADLGFIVSFFSFQLKQNLL